MAKFTYNYAKNVSTGHMFFKLNYSYYLWILYKEEVDSHSKSKLADGLLVELGELIIIFQENFHHAQELYK